MPAFIGTDKLSNYPFVVRFDRGMIIVICLWQIVRLFCSNKCLIMIVFYFYFKVSFVDNTKGYRYKDRAAFMSKLKYNAIYYSTAFVIIEQLQLIVISQILNPWS